MKVRKKPHLLSPAGSYDALCAAVSAGADEVYFGAAAFNARAGAKNFSHDELASGIRLCRVCGVKTHLAVNTLLFDREINEALDLIYDAACLGADAFIVQDIGLASAVRREMPDVVLHASTQCACHNRAAAQMLYDAGFSRIVLARELSASEISDITADAPYETEIFVHGALCVSHSGQCLFSAAVGGRSGNRGMCAQPCRMAYTLTNGVEKKRCAEGFLLSLKDLSLARHIPALMDLGVAALKIEGRMKSPAYVYGTTKLLKTLLDEGRAATDDEIEALSDLFSREGFTDAYFTGHGVGTPQLYGVRTDAQKRATAQAEKETEIPSPKCEISAECSLRTGFPPVLTFTCGIKRVTVTGNAPLEAAQSAAADFESVAKNLIKLGDTPFSLPKTALRLTLDGSPFVPAGLLNALRRDACDALLHEMTKPIGVRRTKFGFVPPSNAYAPKTPSVRLYLAGFSDAKRKISGFSDFSEIESLVFPLECFRDEKISAETSAEASADSFADASALTARLGIPFGILFPRVLSNGETEGARKALLRAKALGAAYCEVSNLGHIDLVRACGLTPYGGIGLNLTNTLAAEYAAFDLSLPSIVLSPEMKFGALRDLAKADGVKYCLYARGRLPLMVLESCVVRARGGCKKTGSGVCGVLSDRMAKHFPVRAQQRFDRAFPCRNIIYNADMTDLLRKKVLYLSGIDVLCISAEDDGMPM